MQNLHPQGHAQGDVEETGDEHQPHEDGKGNGVS
jgi:hypothetical protein